MVADILRLMGQPFNKKILDELIDEVDADSKLKKKKTMNELYTIIIIIIILHYSICFLVFKLILESGRLEFDEFVTLAAKFIVEEDAEALEKELREAFRLYDKEGNKIKNE